MFQPGQFVQSLKGKKQRIMQIVDVMDSGDLRCRDYRMDGNYGSAHTVSVDTVAVLPPFQLKPDELQSLCRFETELSMLAGMNLPENFIAPLPYSMTLWDLQTALENHIAAETTAEAFWKSYYLLLNDLLAKPLGIEKRKQAVSEDDLNQNSPLLLNEERSFLTLWRFLDNIGKQAVWKPDDSAKEAFCLEDCCEAIRLMKTEACHPVEERAYPDFLIREFLSYWQKNDLSHADAQNIRFFRLFTDELCEKGEAEGFLSKGYSSYIGNAAYPQNYTVSRDCMLKLLEVCPENAYSANTLGYIYYYGRVNHGKPQYEEAFRYFSIGAFAGIHESRYKAADMLLGGLGVPRNYEAARRLYVNVFNESLPLVTEGHFDCKFADIAFRMGNLLRDGICFPEDKTTAYQMYLKAEYALEQRIEMANHPGDVDILSRIRKAREELKPQLGFRTDVTVYQSKTPWLLRPEENETYRLSWKAQKDGTVRLNAKKLVFPQQQARLSFVVVPECDYCTMTDSFTLYAENVKELCVPENAKHFDYQSLSYDQSKRIWIFINPTEGTQLSFQADTFLLRIPPKREVTLKS